jgi:hypothetical protein
VVYFA